MKYQVIVNQVNKSKNDAGTKAVKDCNIILKRNHYKMLQVNIVKRPYLAFFNIFKIIINLIIFFLQIRRDSIIVLQYPLYGLKSYFKFYLKALRQKDCYTVCVIHDLNSLRYKMPLGKVQKEIAILNSYNAIVSHNSKMSWWLTQNGCNTVIIDLEIFDYISGVNTAYPQNKGPNFDPRDFQVVIAGNLSRGKYIHQLALIPDTNFILYGPGYPISLGLSQSNVIWKGSISGDLLPTLIEGDFGLIWDGDELDDCEGQYGDYIRFNNPHKFSLYLSAGLPVIVPRKAALAQFVLENDIGFVIESLFDLPSLLQSVSAKRFLEYKKNVEVISLKVRSGFYYQRAVETIERVYLINNKLLKKDVEKNHC